MFGIYDHLNGAIKVRIRRFFLKLKKQADISWIDDNLGFGGVSIIESLSNKGIQAILDVRNESRDNEEELRKFSISYLRIGVMDRGTPKKSDIIEAINWIEKNVKNNKKVFIHCNLGRGRGPLVMILYLISKGMEKTTAINLIKNKRSFTFLNKKQLQIINKFQNQTN